MNGPKKKAAEIMRKKEKKIVCWEENYNEFFDFLRDETTAHERMPQKVRMYMRSMKPTDYEGFTRHQAIVFYREKYTRRDD